LDSNNFLIDVSNGGSATPASVMMPDMSSGGVISKAGFITLMSSGAVFLPATPVT